MRRLDEIILHYTATPAGRDVGVEEIRRWHVEERGWADIGYHFVVRLNGEIERGRPLDIIGAHTLGYNENSIGVCYVGGGVGEDTRTPAQAVALDELIEALRTIFGPLPVYGHKDKGSTLCPGFNANAEYN